MSVRVARTRWNAVTLVLAGVMLQYVWRVQEVFPMLRFIQFTLVVSVAAILLFLTNGNPGRRLRHLRTPLYRLVLAILVLAVLSVPTSLRDGASFQFITGNLAKTVLLVGVLAAAVRDRNDVERLLRVFVLGGAAYVAASVVFASPGWGRLGGRGSYDPNDLGLYTVSTIPLCVYLMRRAAPWTDRLLGIGSALLLLYGTVQSGSRGGFLALVAVALYGLLALSTVRSSKRLTALAIAGAVMAGVGSDAYWERMRTILAPQQDYNWAGQSESGRIEVWKRGLGYMVRRPLFGVGVNQFEAAEGTMAEEGIARQQFGIGFKWSAAHSSYVQIGAELGVLGLGVFVALILLAFREARTIGRRATHHADRLLGQAFGGLVVGFGVGGAFLSQAYATYLYFALGLLMAFSRVVDRTGRPAATSPGISVEPTSDRGVLRPAAAAARRRR